MAIVTTEIYFINSSSLRKLCSLNESCARFTKTVLALRKNGCLLTACVYPGKRVGPESGLLPGFYKL